MFRNRCVALAATIAALTVPAVAPAATVGGLTSAQAHQLQRVGFAVVPDPPPAGFLVQTLQTNTSNGSFRIVYVRRTDDATLTIAGQRGGATAQTSKKRGGGFFGQIAHAIDNIGAAKPSTGQVATKSNGNSSTSSETEEGMSSVEADSLVIGPTHFVADHACLTGSPEPGRSQITGVTFTVSGCNLDRNETLTRAYRSLVRVGA